MNEVKPKSDDTQIDFRNLFLYAEEEIYEDGEEQHHIDARGFFASALDEFLSGDDSKISALRRWFSEMSPEDAAAHLWLFLPRTVEGTCGDSGPVFAYESTDKNGRSRLLGLLDPGCVFFSPEIFLVVSCAVPYIVDELRRVEPTNPNADKTWAAVFVAADSKLLGDRDEKALGKILAAMDARNVEHFCSLDTRFEGFLEAVIPELVSEEEFTDNLPPL